MGKYGSYVICVLFVATKPKNSFVFVINIELHFMTFDTVHLFNLLALEFFI